MLWCDRAVVVVFGAALAGCAPAAYGVKACTEASGLSHGTQMAYQTPGVGTPVCMPPQATIYITCLRELGRLDVPAGGSGLDASRGARPPGADPQAPADLRIEYVDQARLTAVNYCAKAAGLSK